MGLYSGGLIIGRIFASEIWETYYSVLFIIQVIVIIIIFRFGGGGGGRLLSEFYFMSNIQSFVTLVAVGCNNVVCREKNHSCMVDQYMRAYCVDCKKLPCSKRSKEDGPLCGADGEQYDSSCHLRLQTCRQGRTIGVAYNGSCIGKYGSCIGKYGSHAIFIITVEP